MATRRRHRQRAGRAVVAAVASPIVVWSDDGFSFSIEQEATNLSDYTIDCWLAQLHAELGHWQHLRCNVLNVSRNRMGDYAITNLMYYFLTYDIPINTLKAYKNCFGDSGLFAIRTFTVVTSAPIAELHVSHNCITSVGAMKLLDAIQHYGRYPMAGRKPLWLRMENNAIDWDHVRAKLSIWWESHVVSSERRHAHTWQGSAFVPQVSIHGTYVYQTLPRRVEPSAEEQNPSLHTPGHLDVRSSSTTDGPRPSAPQVQINTRSWADMTESELGDGVDGDDFHWRR